MLSLDGGILVGEWRRAALIALTVPALVAEGIGAGVPRIAQLASCCPSAMLAHLMDLAFATEAQASSLYPHLGALRVDASGMRGDRAAGRRPLR